MDFIATNSTNLHEWLLRNLGLVAGDETEPTDIRDHQNLGIQSVLSVPSLTTSSSVAKQPFV